MQGPLGWIAPVKRPRPGLTADFRRALTREILLTERLRVKAILITFSVLMGSLTAVYLIFPDVVERIWRQFSLVTLLTVYAGAAAFELWVLWLIGRWLAMGKDLPLANRYLGAAVEASLPTIALYFHMSGMGAAPALAFVAPLAYFIFIILSTLRLDFWLSSFTGAVAAIELFAMAMLYHPPQFIGEPQPDFGFHLVRSMMLLVCGLLAGAVGVQLRRQFEASIAAAGARDRVTNLFGQHVSPKVVERLLASGAPTSGETRDVVVMFVDFRRFTAAARSRPPDQVVMRLDQAFAVLVDILDRHVGIVNKFLGDGFLALFGAPIADPEAPRRAVAAAREMLAAMEQSNASSDWPLRIGIGIHVGAAVVGNVGSPRRKEYTVIGDTVNFAARLEALNKEFGSQLLISSALRDTLGEESAGAACLGEVLVRGYDTPQAVWRLG